MLLPTSSSSHSHSHSCSYTTRTLYPMVDSPSSCGLCYVDCRVCVIRVSRWLDIYIYFLIFIYIIFQLLFLLYFTLLWCISLHSKYLCIYPFRFAIGFDNILTPFYCIFLSLWGKYAIALVPIFLNSYYIVWVVSQTDSEISYLIYIHTATMYLEFWKRRNAELAILWDVEDYVEMVAIRFTYINIY